MIALLLAMTAATQIDGTDVTKFTPMNPATYLAIEIANDKIRLADFETRYQDDHPTLMRQRRRIEVLEEVLQGQDDAIDQKLIDATITLAIVKAETNLKLLQIDLRENHHRVQLEKRRLDNLKELQPDSVNAKD